MKRRELLRMGALGTVLPHLPLGALGGSHKEYASNSIFKEPEKKYPLLKKRMSLFAGAVRLA